MKLLLFILFCLDISFAHERNSDEYYRSLIRLVYSDQFSGYRQYEAMNEIKYAFASGETSLRRLTISHEEFRRLHYKSRIRFLQDCEYAMRHARYGSRTYENARGWAKRIRREIECGR